MIERVVICQGEGFLFVGHRDGSVAIQDPKGNTVAGWPMTASLDAHDISSKSDEELCGYIGRVSGPHKAPRISS